MLENLSQKEKMIFQIIKDHVYKNRPLEVNKIVPFIRNHSNNLNINSRGIKNIIKSLIEKKIVIEGSMLTKDEVLTHENRSEIYEYIQEHSAVYYYELVKNLDIASHVVIWHLNVLLDFGFIKREIINNQKVYYLSDLTLKEAKLFYYTNKKKIKRILEFIMQNELGTTRTQIAKKLGIHPNTVKKYIPKLVQLQLISQIKSKNRNLYIINKDARYISPKTKE